MLRGVAGLLPLSCRSTRAAGRRSRRPASRSDDRLRVIEPLGYLDFLSLVRGAALVVTDSGGIQEETTILRRPLPDAAARTPSGRSRSATARTGSWSRPMRRAVDARDPRRRAACPDEPPPLWDGHAGERIAESIAEVAGARRDRVPAEVGRPAVTGSNVGAILPETQHTVRGARQPSPPPCRARAPEGDPLLEDP